MTHFAELGTGKGNRCGGLLHAASFNCADELGR
jgi:hypothetical protein